MPSAWRAHVIAERLRQEGLRAAVDEFDIYRLPPEMRHLVLDVMVAEHASFPLVIVNQKVASHSGVDLEAVLRAAREAAAEDCCC